MGVSLGAGGSVEPKRRGEIQKNVQERTLREMTNKLEVGLVSFKPVWSRTKLSSGVVSRERIG